MRNQPVRVLIASEPEVLRSAVASILARDERLRIQVREAHEDRWIVAGEAPVDALIISRESDLMAIVAPGTLIVRVDEVRLCLELCVDGAVTELPYEGLSALADLLVERCGAGPPASSTPRSPAPTESLEGRSVRAP